MSLESRLAGSGCFPWRGRLSIAAVAVVAPADATTITESFDSYANGNGHHRDRRRRCVAAKPELELLRKLESSLHIAGVAQQSRPLVGEFIRGIDPLHAHDL